MTFVRMLAELRAARDSRNAYQRAADRLAEEAITLRHRGFPTMARQYAVYANVAQRAARAEYES